MKKSIIVILVIGIIFGGVLNALEDDGPVSDEISSEPTPTEIVVITEPPSPEPTPIAPPSPEPTPELSDAERLGVSEKELNEIEHVMNVGGWEFDRDDFERIYRLKDSEMTLNPVNFVEYDVSIVDGETHRIIINKRLVE